MKRSPVATFARYWLPPIFWYGVISFLSSSLFAAQRTIRFFERLFRLLIPGITPEAIAFIHTIARKTAHFGEFFVLALLLYRAFRRDEPTAWRWDRAVLTGAVAIGLSLLDEFHQLFVPGRTGSLRDSMLDSAGALTAVLFLFARTLLLKSSASGMAANTTIAQK